MSPLEQEVKRISPHIDFSSHCIRLMKSLEPDCKWALQRKRAVEVAWVVKWDTFSSPVCGKDSRNCAHFEQFCGDCSLVSLQSRRRGGEVFYRKVAVKSQPAFGESAVCDRIAFARWSLRNRTANVPSREKCGKASLRLKVGHFLQSGSRAKSAELRQFQRFFE